MSDRPLVEFHFVLMDGKGEGWVYAHEMRKSVYHPFFNHFGFYNEVIFSRDGIECQRFQNFEKAEETTSRPASIGMAYKLASSMKDIWNETVGEVIREPFYRPTPRAADECPVCNGLGDIVKNESIEECPECEGTGIRS